MSQQINLLDASLQPKREWLTLLNVALGMLAVLLMLVIAVAWGWLREAQEREHFAVAERRLRQAQEELMELAGQQSRRVIDPQLEVELANSTQLLQGKKEVMAVLEQGGLGEKVGFARYLQGFARQVVDGVWITGFDLTAGKKTFEVRGRLRQESLLPRFVQQLNQEPVFQGRRFAALDMHRVDPDKAPAGAAPATPAPAPQPAVVEFVLLGDPVKAGTTP
ncbi:MAG: PilN domain-containing protein [Bacteroidota bacterium]